MRRFTDDEKKLAVDLYFNERLTGASGQQPYIQIAYNDSPPACPQVDSSGKCTVKNSRMYGYKGMGRKIDGK